MTYHDRLVQGLPETRFSKFVMHVQDLTWSKMGLRVTMLHWKVLCNEAGLYVSRVCDTLTALSGHAQQGSVCEVGIELRSFLASHAYSYCNRKRVQHLLY